MRMNKRSPIGWFVGKVVNKFKNVLTITHFSTLIVSVRKFTFSPDLKLRDRLFRWQEYCEWFGVEFDIEKRKSRRIFGQF